MREDGDALDPALTFTLNDSARQALATMSLVDTTVIQRAVEQMHTLHAEVMAHVYEQAASDLARAFPTRPLSDLLGPGADRDWQAMVFGCSAGRRIVGWVRQVDRAAWELVARHTLGDQLAPRFLTYLETREQP